MSETLPFVFLVMAILNAGRAVGFFISKANHSVGRGLDCATIAALFGACAGYAGGIP